MWVVSGSICNMSAWPKSGAAVRIKPMKSRFVRIPVLILQFRSDSEHSDAERCSHGRELYRIDFADVESEQVCKQFGPPPKGPDGSVTQARCFAERQHQLGHERRTPPQPAMQESIWLL